MEPRRRNVARKSLTSPLQRDSRGNSFWRKQSNLTSRPRQNLKKLLLYLIFNFLIPSILLYTIHGANFGDHYKDLSSQWDLLMNMKLKDSCFDLCRPDWSNNGTAKRKAVWILEYLWYLISLNGATRLCFVNICIVHLQLLIYLLLSLHYCRRNKCLFSVPFIFSAHFRFAYSSTRITLVRKKRKKKLLTRYRSVPRCFRLRFVYRSVKEDKKKYRVRTAEWKSTDLRLQTRGAGYELSVGYVLAQSI